MGEGEAWGARAGPFTGPGGGSAPGPSQFALPIQVCVPLCPVQRWHPLGRLIGEVSRLGAVGGVRGVGEHIPRKVSLGR